MKLKKGNRCIVCFAVALFVWMGLFESLLFLATSEDTEQVEEEVDEVEIERQ